MAAVNRPTDIRQKEKDVNQKLQLYGIYRAFANGKVPSNKQIDVALNSALDSPALAKPDSRLSSEGQHLVEDLRDVIEKAKILLLTKNQGNLLQDFIWQCENISGGDAGKPNAPVGKDTAKQHGNEALDGLRTLGQLLLSNGQFRKLLSDASVLIRDMVGDAAQAAANKVNPSQDELDHMDEPAEDNTWHDTPDLSGNRIKGALKDRVNKVKPFSRGDLQDAAGDASEAASGSRDPTDAASQAAQDQQQGTDHGVDARQGAKQGLQNLKEKASSNIPDEHKDRARKARDKTRDKTKDYLKEKMPKERRDQIIWRLRKMVVEIQGHEDYQRAINTMLRLAETYTGYTKDIAQQGTGTVKDAHSDTGLRAAEADLKTLLERFANFTSFDDLFDAINEIYRDADRDPELKSWFRHLNEYIRKCLKQQGYIMEDAATDEWNKIYDKGEFLLRDRYRNHTDRVVDELKFLASQFEEDPHNKAFADAMQKLFDDLGKDDKGNPTFKTHLVKDLTDVILPAIFKDIRYVPIPRIEYSDPMVDAVVENLVIESDNLMPNVLEITNDNYWRWGRKTASSRNKNKIKLAVSGVQMDLKDVSFYVRKKQGFPSLRDMGIADIYLGGTGLSFQVAMETADESQRQQFFKVNSVVVDIKNLKVNLKQSNHKTLFSFAKSLVLTVMRPAIQKVIEKQIRDSIQDLDRTAYRVQKEVDRAKEEAKNNPEEAGNILQRYLTAAQDTLSKTRQKSQEAAKDKKVNVAVTQHDSLFKNISLPGGISTKATEYNDLAAKGDKWESPVFSIGSARETTNLPQIPSVRRKRHDVTQGGVRGPQNLGHDSSQAEGVGRSDMQGDGQNDDDFNLTGNVGASATRTAGVSTGQYEYGPGAYGQTNGTAGFSSQVNQAFDGPADYRYKQEPTGINGPPAGQNGMRTLLGTHNPVLTGEARAD